jgi:hypothetical protein
MMKTKLDDPQWTAWLLGELGPQEAAEMERAVAADPALQMAASEQQEFLSQLTSMMGGEVQSLDARQRDAILRSARNQDAAAHAPANVVAMPQKPFRGWAWVSMAAAAALVFGIMLTQQVGIDGKSGMANTLVTREIALLASDAGDFPVAEGDEALTAVGGSNAAQLSEEKSAMVQKNPALYLTEVAKRIANDPLPKASELPDLRDRGFLSAEKYPRATLPTMAGKASWSWVKRSIIEKKQLPSPRMVRVEEMLNQFSLAIEANAVLSGVSFHVEAAPVVERNGRHLVAVTMFNHQSDAVRIDAHWLAAAGSRYRLLGFGGGNSQSKNVTRLPGGMSTTIMLEVESTTAVLGRMELGVGDESLQIDAKVTTQPSDSWEFLRTMVSFAEWLRAPSSDASELLDQVQRMEGKATSDAQRAALVVMKQAMSL